MSRMEFGSAGMALLMQDEELRLATYDDKTGRTLRAGEKAIGVASIGWGDTDPAVAVAGNIITREVAESLLKNRLNGSMGIVSRINTMIGAHMINQNQFDALVCFGYNVGCGAKGLLGSTLLQKVLAGDFAGAALEFARWDKSGGHVMAGLDKRRADEKKLFLTPCELVN